MTSGVMTTVNIFDREYSVISDLRSDYLLQLAAYIDSKMTVTKVHSHTKKPEQTRFDFDKTE